MFIDCMFLVTVHRAIYISMRSSLVKMSVKLLQPSQSPSLGLFTVIFFLTLTHQLSVLPFQVQVAILARLDQGIQYFNQEHVQGAS